LAGFTLISCLPHTIELTFNGRFTDTTTSIHEF
jgi:hypothetical protein